MLFVAPHDANDPDDESATERALLALRAARVRWSVDATTPADPASPFTTGSSTGDDAGPLFAT